jgi:hypothetical protein
MNYQAFTNDSLTMMYEGIRRALAADDALGNQVPRSGDTRLEGTCRWHRGGNAQARNDIRGHRLVRRSGIAPFVLGRYKGFVSWVSGTEADAATVNWASYGRRCRQLHATVFPARKASDADVQFKIHGVDEETEFGNRYSSYLKFDDQPPYRNSQ